MKVDITTQRSCSPSQQAPIFVVGYTQTPKELIDLLQQLGISALIDVRTLPYSNDDHLQAFNRNRLLSTCFDAKLRYVHLEALAPNGFKGEDWLARYQERLKKRKHRWLPALKQLEPFCIFIDAPGPAQQALLDCLLVYYPELSPIAADQEASHVSV